MIVKSRRGGTGYGVDCGAANGKYNSQQKNCLFFFLIERMVNKKKIIPLQKSYTLACIVFHFINLPS